LRFPLFGDYVDAFGLFTVEPVAVGLGVREPGVPPDRVEYERTAVQPSEEETTSR
jgi:hypothetical protein